MYAQIKRDDCRAVDFVVNPHGHTFTCYKGKKPPNAATVSKKKSNDKLVCRFHHPRPLIKHTHLEILGSDRNSLVATLVSQRLDRRFKFDSSFEVQYQRSRLVER